MVVPLFNLKDSPPIVIKLYDHDTLSDDFMGSAVIDVAKDFTALLIIADFDDFFGDNIEDESSKMVCQQQDGAYADLFLIQTTTSLSAKGAANCRRNRDKINEFINHQRRLKTISRPYDSDFKPMKPTKGGKETIFRPLCVRLDYRVREPLNKVLYATYRVLRVVHVSVYFYSFPFLFLVALYLVPVYKQSFSWILS